MSQGRALVTDAHRRQAIVAIRNLGRNGVAVTAASSKPLAPGGFSRYADRRLRHAPPDEDAFVADLERELRRGDYDVLLPVSSAATEPVVRHRDRLDRLAAIPYPPYDRWVGGHDKAQTAAAARAAGVPVPRTLAPDSLDLDAVDRHVGYPAVVKPRRASGSLGVTVCESPAEVAAAYEAVDASFGRPMIQSYVPNGGEAGVYTVYDDNAELTGLTVQRRLRTNPPGGGPSTLRETVEAPDLVRYARALFEELSWTGPAMAEFRTDARTGQPRLLEVNPRLWGSLSLTVRAGVPVPHMLYRLATAGTCDPALEYRVGVQTRQLLGDLGNLLRREDGAAALREFLARSGDTPRGYDVLSRDDPLVAPLYAAGALAGTVNRALRER